MAQPTPTRIRLTAAELEALQAAAHGDDMAPSTWIRELLRETLGTPLPASPRTDSSITTRISGDLRLLVDVEAEEAGLSLSEFVRARLLQYLAGD